MESMKRRKLSNTKSAESLKQNKTKPREAASTDTANAKTVKAEAVVAPAQSTAESSKDSPASSPQNKSESEADSVQEREPAQGQEAGNQDEKVTEEELSQTFKELGIIDTLCDACDQLGFKKPTPIQAKSIPMSLQGRDIVALAETGSGKTAAFALPILQALLEKPSPFFSLVLSPTRELAHQIAQTFEGLGSLISVRCAVIVGGMDMVAQAVALAKKPHIIVATPGRLFDHLEKTKGFSLRSLKYLVMDEADRLLDMDFGPLIEKILKFVPRERRTFLFSATMSSKVESLQRASLRDPLRVSVTTNRYQTVSTLLQNYLFVPHVHKDTYLVFLANEFHGQSAIIFTRTVYDTQRIAILLRSLNFGAIPLHGQLSQSARLGALNKFKTGSRDILVATDVAARGLDIPKVDLVLNYDLPQDSKTYVHRVGRTARAGNSGRAISLVTQYDLEIWLRIEAALGKKQEEYPTEKAEVMVFSTRVEEVQRHARNEMKNLMEDRGKKGATLKGKYGKKRGRDHMDAEEG